MARECGNECVSPSLFVQCYFIVCSHEVQQLAGFVGIANSMFGEYILRGSLSNKTTLNELVGEVHQIQADCVREYANVTVDHSDDICIIGIKLMFKPVI